jgi:hypothetical protein
MGLWLADPWCSGGSLKDQSTRIVACQASEWPWIRHQVETRGQEETVYAEFMQ